MPTPRRQRAQPLRDLGARWSHQVLENVHGGVDLRSGQIAEGVLQVLSDDLLRTAELFQRREPQHARAGAPFRAGTDLVIPQALHDQLEVGRLDAVRVGNARAVGATVGVARVPLRICHLPLAGVLSAHLANFDLAEHRVDEVILERHVRVRLDELVEPRDRPGYRLSCGVTREWRHPQPRVQEPRNGPFEPIQLRERILSDRDEDVHPKAPVVDELWELHRERAGAVAAAVIQRQILELIEDQEQRCIQSLRSCRDRLHERRLGRFDRLTGPAGDLAGDRPGEGRSRAHPARHRRPPARTRVCRCRLANSSWRCSRKRATTRRAAATSYRRRSRRTAPSTGSPSGWR